LKKSECPAVVTYDRAVKRTESADAVPQMNVPPADLVHTEESLLTGEKIGTAQSS
jgi:hypothetical protein